jgi:endoglucanase
VGDRSGDRRALSLSRLAGFEMRGWHSLTAAAVLALGALAGCGGDPNQNSTLAAMPDGGLYPTPTPVPPAATYPTGLHAVGNQILDGNGQTIVLHGANRSGTEYKCIQTATAIFDGPFDEASVAAIASWKLNAVRVPLNESCWLGTGGVAAATSGTAYASAILAYVALLHKYGLVPILDLHWVAPGNMPATREQPMPDADNAPAFWTGVASTFKNDTGVVFEPYNEPYPDSNHDSDAGWACWRDGCTLNLSVATGATPTTYVAAGMQALVTAIRDTGATNLILLGGLEYSNALSQWLAYEPTDTANNLGAAWHIYSNNACMSETCYGMAPATVAAAVPLVATEIGESDCQGTFITPLMQWLDGHSSGYLAWSWNAFGVCVPASTTAHGSPWSLVSSYTTAVPDSAFADTFYEHVTGL